MYKYSTQTGEKNGRGWKEEKKIPSSSYRIRYRTTEFEYGSIPTYGRVTFYCIRVQPTRYSFIDNPSLSRLNEYSHCLTVPPSRFILEHLLITIMTVRCFIFINLYKNDNSILRRRGVYSRKCLSCGEVFNLRAFAPAINI